MDSLKHMCRLLSMKKKQIAPHKGGIDPDCEEDISSDYEVNSNEGDHSSGEMDSSYDTYERDDVPDNENEIDDVVPDKDESDDLPYDDEDIANDDVHIRNKRGPARGKKQIQKWKKQPGKVEVMYNKLGMPIGDPADDISTLCGVLARSTIPITYNNWKLVPQDLKERVWETINVSF